jgi:hypothetical protein
MTEIQSPALPEDNQHDRDKAVRNRPSQARTALASLNLNDACTSSLPNPWLDVGGPTTKLMHS